MRRIRPNTSPPSRRHGALTVEFALVVPLLFFFFFAQFEFSRANMIRNVIKTACYEGARAGVVPGATSDQIRETAQNILTLPASPRPKLPSRPVWSRRKPPL